MSSKVYVGNVSYDAMEGEIEDLFSEVGQIVEVFLPVDRATGRPRGFAFVEFGDEEAVAKAIEKFDGHELNGRALRVSEAEDKQPSPSKFSSGSGKLKGSKKSGKPKGSRRNVRAKKRGY
ncbi:MAG: RNA recognition motif domain-containing protein [Dehalococcoidia bacterium]